MTFTSAVRPPWTAVLSDGEHTVLLFAVLAAVLAMLATLVRERFASSEVHGEYRTAGLTGTSIVAIALVSYVLVLVTVLVGYTPVDGTWVPTAVTQYAWSIRYADWAITVPLLVVELLAVSVARTPSRKDAQRRAGMVLAFLMIVLGFIGAFVVDGGRSFEALAGFGAVSAVCFLALALMIVRSAMYSLPRIVEPARRPYRSAVSLLVVVWFAYPIVYGLQGTTSGGTWAVIGAVILSVADVTAKVGFGSLVHRAAVYQSRAEEDASPTTQRRPRTPEADSLWVGEQGRYDRDGF
ncbi:bacteriorhodopsin [Amnibacterium kyonggiense]|uniref:Bacteriorhodopsin-like protein n=1 Tax=Amnibacterium kyonggiense TaxID=595671 RepID=A0A4V3EB42_9MICO|nr:bacteriorhodopsin [Amnibacterium kyonggiense]TDS80274.1 bacteriorhodopsin-like protein [Amnibacterium kyonggiense]